MVYTFTSAVLGHIATRLLKLPIWTTPAICFNNTTSLPLLLIQSLEASSFLDNLVKDGSTHAAVNRAKSFFLINAMTSNALTFAFGPHILKYESDYNKVARSPDETQR